MHPEAKRFVKEAVLYALAFGCSCGKKEAIQKSQARLNEWAQRRNRLPEDLQLDDYEQLIASQLVLPSDIDTAFEDIGGLDNEITELIQDVLFPLQYPNICGDIQGNDLLASPKGLLLYGPPGCGKTMLAKALAKQSGATFINVNVGLLTDKWFGESNKLVEALFRLAHKLEPTVIFIDEIDSFLRQRQSTDHEAMAQLKAEFMSLWDGLLTGQSRVVVLGATNRIQDIDEAILRRMPKTFHIKLPDSRQRARLLQLFLKGISLDQNFDIEAVVKATEGLSGSYIKETCRSALARVRRELFRQYGMDMESLKTALANGKTLRPLRTEDFFPRKELD
ncbi:outer membrane ATPase Msp1 [Schizosaccharomyces japonicus yFS275]|uniref:Outer membrane ATPase Msp1 n=1 Tax=Schizosaccharomyces japonicus (strain yFS275 / FY16936) TaxID=402676 RepID=B6K675_SCHJY|nr:outer membrane ATPase Msp1 [Schizosaccharomyces japonicus yFS275]EEB09029.2 outer membrane ATPase Msp1 [Schizosaccharomyces japonicus yFS275]